MAEQTNTLQLAKGNEDKEDDVIYDIPVDSPKIPNEKEKVEPVSGAVKAQKDNDDDGDVDALLSSLSTPVIDGSSQPTLHDPRRDAYEKLVNSSASLGTAISIVSTDIDKQYQISGKACELGNRAREVDDNFHITESVMNATASLGSWWSNNVGPVVGSAAVQVKEKAEPTLQATATTVKEKVPPETASGVVDILNNFGSTIKHYDDEHQVSAIAMDKLADGVDWIAKSIIPAGKENADLDELTADAVQSEVELKEEIKESPLPTSPQTK